MQPTECFFFYFFVCNWGLFIKNLIATLIRKVFMNFNLISLSGFFWTLLWSRDHSICQTSFSFSVLCAFVWVWVSCSLKKSCIWHCHELLQQYKQLQCDTRNVMQRKYNIAHWMRIDTHFYRVYRNLFFFLTFIQLLVLFSGLIIHTYTPTHIER